MKSANEIRQQYIDFFVKKYGHKEIPSASLIPEHDPSVLFTTAGMHPLVPFLMGEPHPEGKRLVSVQKCMRTDDIDEVGDSTHLTFFEMLGNWSLGDYFKEGAVKMSLELLTLPWEKGGYGLAKERIFISCFEGDKDAPKDLESYEIWQKMDIPKERIFFYGKAKNWWGPAGATGPCGPDTEMFYDSVGSSDLNLHAKGYACAAGELCQPNCDCGRFIEIWNDVFMQYNKKSDGTYEPLKQKNVDTGLGFERLVAILQNKSSCYETELFLPVMERLYKGDSLASPLIIADHLRAATFILGDPCGVVPSNVDQGYILRRLIRRAIRHAKKIGIENFFTAEIAKLFIPIYRNIYPELSENRDHIISELQIEEERFRKTLERGLKELKHIIDRKKALSGEDAFYIFETYGFPIELIEEEMQKEGLKTERTAFRKSFDEAFKKHQEMSRIGAEKKFAGGLADESEKTKIHHTATHLLNQALRIVLGPHVYQRGSNVTAERLRFDFSHPRKMAPEEIKKVEDIVNEQIQKDLPVHFEIMDIQQAKQINAIGIFEEKYEALGSKVKVYFIGGPALAGQVFSKEICGGPHVENTAVLKKFRILKEEASSAGVRRIKAAVDGVKI